MLACLSVLVVALLIIRAEPGTANRPGTVPGATGTPGPRPTHTVSFVQITGLSQFRLAEPAARNWAADAQLASASASWSQVLSKDQVGAPAEWTYRFYSPARQRLLFVLVQPDGQLTTIEHVVKVTLPPPPIPAGSWLLDSPAALAIWLDYGGDKMLQTNPGLEVLVQLRATTTSPNPVWVVVGADDRTQSMHLVAVDAAEGVVTATGPDS